MRRQNLMSLTVITAGLLVAGRALAGSLDPTNAPGPTMHTLEEIYQKQVDTYQKLNNLTVYTGVPKTGQITPYQTGDDGTYQKGVASPNPRFTVQADTNCVLDNLTGLIWARNANIAGLTTWSNAVVYCESLNYGGQTDWRLPNLRELFSLVDDARANPALPAGHPFASVTDSLYWSGTTYANLTDRAWRMDMFDGYVAAALKTTSLYVWPVRGGQ